MNRQDEKFKEEMQKWMLDLAQNYNVCLTFQFNKDDITENEAKKAIKVAFGTLYRKILGRKWYMRQSEQYPFIGFQEMGKSGMNRHYHFMLKVESVHFCTLCRLIVYLNKGVQKIVKSAKVHVEPLYNIAWGSYIAKEVKSDNNTLMTEKDLRVERKQK